MCGYEQRGKRRQQMSDRRCVNRQTELPPPALCS
jgi:hypothetical protein